MKEISKKINVIQIITILGVLLIIGGNDVRGTWSEPVSAPPSGTAAAPLNIGPIKQEKIGTGIFPGTINTTGSIGANDFHINNLTPPNWASQLGGQGSCDWEGRNCDCFRDSGAESGRLILGTECTNHFISNFRIINYNIGGTACPTATSSAPSTFNLSQCSIYTYTNP